MSQTERTYFINGQVNMEYQMLDGEKHGKFIRYFEMAKWQLRQTSFMEKFKDPGENGTRVGNWRKKVNTGMGVLCKQFLE